MKNCSKFRAERSRGGFVMVEAVVMTVILAVGLLGIISAILAGIEAGEISREAGVAEQVAQMKMGEIELSPLFFLGTKDGTVASGGREYGWQTIVEQTKDPEMLSARVRVKYVVRGKEREIDLPTLLYQRSESGG